MGKPNEFKFAIRNARPASAAGPRMIAAIRHRAVSAARDFLDTEAAGGLLLIAAAALALALANSPAASFYRATTETYIGPLSILHWINDGLMAVFFFLVGLEIKREFVDGHLSRPEHRRLPLTAAVGGMAVPAIVFIAIVGFSGPLARGWAIPAATDIAFALGIMSLLGNRVPATLKLLLTAIAVVDDVGAVLIIALAYTQGLNLLALAAAGLFLALMMGLNRRGEVRLWPYAALALGLWMATYLSGVHATIAGVLAALTVPVRRSPGAPDDPSSPLHRMEHMLAPWVAFAILPAFGFANAGLDVRGLSTHELLSPLPVAIALSLFLGKQAGIFGLIRIAVWLGWTSRPAGVSWSQLYGASVLCGVGFTMSLFIGGLAFSDPGINEGVKLGVLSGSLMSALAGYAILRFSRPIRRP